jgi:hypothetical protein
MRVPSLIPNFRLIEDGITICPFDVAVVSIWHLLTPGYFTCASFYPLCLKVSQMKYVRSYCIVALQKVPAYKRQ